MRKEPLIGLRITSTSSFDETYEKEIITYSITIGTRRKGELFVTTPTIRKEISKVPYLEKKPIEVGEMVVYAETRLKRIWTVNVSPLHGFPSLAGKGVATLIELQIEKDLLRRFPEYTIISSKFAGQKRQRQIIRRKRTPGVQIPLSIAKELSRQKAISDYKKHKPKKIFQRVRRYLHRLFH